MKTSFVIDEKILERIKIVAIKKRMSLGELLRFLIQDFLDKNENNN